MACFHTIGHITRDRVGSAGGAREQAGGAAHYAALTLARLGERVAVTTRMAASDRPALLAELKAAGVEVRAQPSPATTTFESVWLDAAMRRRALTVGARAAPFTADDLPAATAAGFPLLLGPLLGGDMDARFIERAAARGVVALDAQGMVRAPQDGRVAAQPWADMEAGLKVVGFVKADAEEAALLTGEAEPLRAARRLVRHLGTPPQEAIVTMAGAGAVIATPRSARAIAALPGAPAVDATGCGDTFFAAYLARRRRGDGVAAAGRFAAVCATFTLERQGAFAASLPRVLARRDGWQRRRG